MFAEMDHNGTSIREQPVALIYMPGRAMVDAIVSSSPGIIPKGGFINLHITTWADAKSRSTPTPDCIRQVELKGGSVFDNSLDDNFQLPNAQDQSFLRCPDHVMWTP